MEAWTWPEDDQLVVNRHAYWRSAYQGRGLTEQMYALRQVSDWEKRRSAPIRYLLKYKEAAIAERVYYRLARHFDLPQQHVFWAILQEADGNPGEVAAAIKYEPEAVLPKSIDLEPGTAMHRGKRWPVENPWDFVRHWVMHVFCSSFDGANQVMLKGATLFGVDAAECRFEGQSVGQWRAWIERDVRSKSEPEQQVIYAMLRRLADSPRLPQLVLDELLAAPFWTQLKERAYEIQHNLGATQASLLMALEPAI